MEKGYYHALFIGFLLGGISSFFVGTLLLNLNIESTLSGIIIFIIGTIMAILTSTKENEEDKN